MSNFNDVKHFDDHNDVKKHLGSVHKLDDEISDNFVLARFDSQDREFIQENYKTVKLMVEHYRTVKETKIERLFKKRVFRQDEDCDVDEQIQAQLQGDNVDDSKSVLESMKNKIENLRKNFLSRHIDMMEVMAVLNRNKPNNPLVELLGESDKRVEVAEGVGDALTSTNDEIDEQRDERQ